MRILVIPRENREFCAVENCEFFGTDVRNHAHCTPPAFVYDRPCMLSTITARVCVDVPIICARAVKVFAFVTHPMTHRFSHENGSGRPFNFAFLYLKSLSQLLQKSHQTASISFVTAECDVITSHLLHVFRRS